MAFPIKKKEDKSKKEEVKKGKKDSKKDEMKGKKKFANLKK